MVAELQSQERVNLASKQPEIVAQLFKQMATYTPYVNPFLSAEELNKYDCVTTNVSGGLFPSPWWGEFNGPVCYTTIFTSLPVVCMFAFLRTSLVGRLTRGGFWVGSVVARSTGEFAGEFIVSRVKSLSRGSLIHVGLLRCLCSRDSPSDSATSRGIDPRTYVVATRAATPRRTHGHPVFLRCGQRKPPQTASSLPVWRQSAPGGWRQSAPGGWRQSAPSEWRQSAPGGWRQLALALVEDDPLLVLPEIHRSTV